MKIWGKFRSLTIYFAVILLASIAFVQNGSIINTNASSTYDAKIVNQSKRDNYIYASCPSNSTKEVWVNYFARDFNNHYVRVMDRIKTHAGTFAYIRYYGKYLGWIKVSCLKKTDINVIAASALNQANLSGEVLLNYAGFSHQIVLARGYASKAKRIDNQSKEKEIYPLASLQKAMTGAMIEQLIASGKLSPETRLSEFYPEIKDSNNITIQRMLSMTSGISSGELLPATKLSEDQAFSSMQSRVVSTGSSSFKYSDANYVLLAGIITKITQKSYSKNLQLRILRPLQMHHTYIAGSSIGKEIIPESYNQTGYHSAARLSIDRETAIPGAGNVYATIQDFANFEKGLNDGQILSKSQYRILLSYGSFYSGGQYVDVPGIKHAHGAFGGDGFSTDLFSDTDNYHLALVFLNAPLKDNLSPKQFVSTMYNIAKYY